MSLVVCHQTYKSKSPGRLAVSGIFNVSENRVITVIKWRGNTEATRAMIEETGQEPVSTGLEVSMAGQICLAPMSLAVVLQATRLNRSRRCCPACGI